MELQPLRPEGQGNVSKLHFGIASLHVDTEWEGFQTVHYHTL